MLLHVFQSDNAPVKSSLKETSIGDHISEVLPVPITVVSEIS